MEHRLQISIILLVFLEVGYMTQVTFVQNIYRKTEPGQNIIGKIAAEERVDSKIECSIK